LTKKLRPQMAAVILFASISLIATVLIVSLGSAENSVLANRSLLGVGGIDQEHNENIITLSNTSVLSYNIPSASPELAFSQKETTTYTVKTGDTLSQIADKNGISLETLLWTNGLTSRSTIQPGQDLEILPVSGTKHVVKNGENVSLIASRYGVSIANIMEFNNLPIDAFINIGDELIIPGGTPPAQAPARTTYYATTAGPNLNTSGYFIYPTSGRNWGVLHPVNAIDIANSCGTPIYAAAGGKVKLVDEVGWNRGYGKYAMITHPNGVETLYAHFSDIVVSAGTSLDQGDLIGYMGTTGHSTGCHLHFEVRGATNPFVRS